MLNIMRSAGTDAYDGVFERADRKDLAKADRTRRKTVRSTGRTFRFR